MKRDGALALLGLIVLTGCASGSGFHPQTRAGAQCKVQCAQDMARCLGAPYTCDRAASTCMNACADLDAMSR